MCWSTPSLMPSNDEDGIHQHCGLSYVAYSGLSSVICWPAPSLVSSVVYYDNHQHSSLSDVVYFYPFDMQTSSTPDAISRWRWHQQASQFLWHHICWPVPPLMSSNEDGEWGLIPCSPHSAHPAVLAMRYVSRIIEAWRLLSFHHHLQIPHGWL